MQFGKNIAYAAHLTLNNVNSKFSASIGNDNLDLYFRKVIFICLIEAKDFSTFSPKNSGEFPRAWSAQNQL